jgi:hypothetical protein
MPAPVSKKELLKRIEEEHSALFKTIEGVEKKRLLEPGACEQWSVKDILAHLAEWQTMLLGWYDEGLKGNNPQTPAADLKWNQIPALNERIYQKWKNAPLEKVFQELDTTHKRTVELAESLPEDVLFRQQLYPWMRNWPLARWITSGTISHYNWARTLIRKWKK